jgi:hypothetical protein
MRTVHCPLCSAQPIANCRCWSLLTGMVVVVGASWIAVEWHRETLLTIRYPWGEAHMMVWPYVVTFARCANAPIRAPDRRQQREQGKQPHRPGQLQYRGGIGTAEQARTRAAQEVRRGQSFSYAARPGRHGVKREHETRQQDRRRPSAWPASACVPAARSPDQASGLAVMKSAAASHSAQPPVACRTAPLRARSMPRTEATRAQSSSPACPARWLPRRLG